MPTYKLLIDGKMVDTGADLDVLNPATGDLLAKCPRANADDLNRAVSAANAAFPAWSRRPIEERAALLIELADALEARAGEYRACEGTNRMAGS